MLRSLRFCLSLTAAIAAACPAARADAATTTATAAVKVVKPLELRGKQNLAFGQIIMVNVTGPTNVAISQAGVLTCGAGLTCSGAVLPAIYNVRGTNNQVANIFTRVSNLVNSSDGSSIPFAPNAPARITLTSSGMPGNDFSVGGSITISPSTSDGTYSGSIDVTVEYQ